MPGTNYCLYRLGLPCSASPFGDFTRETQAHTKAMNICVYDARNWATFSSNSYVKGIVPSATDCTGLGASEELTRVKLDYKGGRGLEAAGLAVFQEEGKRLFAGAPRPWTKVM